MKRTVLFIHSAGPQGPKHGSSNFITYLKKELSDNYQVIHPNMPEPVNPKYLPWKEQLDKEFSKLTGEVILVGHSLGGSVLIKYLAEETFNFKLSGLFVIAAPFWGYDKNWQLKDFILQSNFEQHLHAIPHLFLYHSRDEKIVPFSHHVAYVEKLPQSIIRELEGEQHLFHHGLPTLIQDIRNL
ncbi:alpha/beta fold hydrolase [Paucisalibacillus sp. EB02]|uniref:alpha/beta fold hydrolase n=1 Tax=Paucisalibacillus sp. EB02 TaxID=1347087 RepID=UPI0005A79812|nr:alpha/beta fold hydrolase [Paucisalibacillus sp. EB02]